MSEKGFVGLERILLFADLLFLIVTSTVIDPQRLRANPVRLPHNPFGQKILSSKQLLNYNSTFVNFDPWHVGFNAHASSAVGRGGRSFDVAFI